MKPVLSTRKLDRQLIQPSIQGIATAFLLSTVLDNSLLALLIAGALLAIGLSALIFRWRCERSRV